MKDYTATELANNTGDVLMAAAQGAIKITRHGRAQFVIMTSERFEKMRSYCDQRRAVGVNNLTNTERSELLETLEASLAEE